MEAFPLGTQARIQGVQGEPALNGQLAVCLGPAEGSTGRIKIRLGEGRELALKPANLTLATKTGALPVGSTVVLVGLKSEALNGKEGKVEGQGEAGRLLVNLDDEGPAKAIKVENLVLRKEDKETNGEADSTANEGAAFETEKQKAARLSTKKALEEFPVGTAVAVHSLPDHVGRTEGDPPLNGVGGVVEEADPVEPGRLVVNLADGRVKSLEPINLVKLDQPEPKKRAACNDPSTTALSVVGDAKRSKTQIAVAGDANAAFLAAARSRAGGGAALTAKPGSEEGKAARSNMLFYARTDVVSDDDVVAGEAIARLVAGSDDFVMKAVCVLALAEDKGEGNFGKKSGERLAALAKYLTRDEDDGVLRRPFKEGQACGSDSDGIAACRQLAEKSLKGKKLLGLLRKNLRSLKDFVVAGFKE